MDAGPFFAGPAHTLPHEARPRRGEPAGLNQRFFAAPSFKKARLFGRRPKQRASANRRKPFFFSFLSSLIIGVRGVDPVAEGHEAVAEVDVLHDRALEVEGEVVVGKVPEAVDAELHEPLGGFKRDRLGDA